LVEHYLAKEDVARSSRVTRSWSSRLDSQGNQPTKRTGFSGVFSYFLTFDSIAISKGGGTRQFRRQGGYFGWVA
jgi:hypothetical protein